ncbi:MAG: hypothetical protein A2W98_13460 [Bacteroidetes bacterium GWF2_33_38]|nr:MAG: hypothetical protein A2W98_13460 [Bacteroidetes bacterium GWF2_33_38]OFY73501.1 MAG: hypothetical protein A2265_10055 [Bacteroidetes bacterium RIFOXYA12_FULL_33_9]OFY88929.1 MAG: hypothetical protein A2236_07305 [Bacteroidetes bacterium RIFOXYA2_FULL_33_7]
MKETDKPTGEQKGGIRDVIDGSVLTKEWVIKQLPYIIFLTFIAILYIGNRYHAEKIIRETTKLQAQVKELRSESIATASELMYISKQSEVSNLVKANNLDLTESVEPPIIIAVKK